MTKAELVDHGAGAVQVPKPQTEAVITRFLQAMMDALHAGDTVEVRGFGSGRLRQRQARAGRNPRTGTIVQIPAKRLPTFRVGKAFQALVQTCAVPAGHTGDVAARRTDSVAP